MSVLCRLWLHKWTRWESFELYVRSEEIGGTKNLKVTRQRRTCSACGMEQRRKP